MNHVLTAVFLKRIQLCYNLDLNKDIKLNSTDVWRAREVELFGNIVWWLAIEQKLSYISIGKMQDKG